MTLTNLESILGLADLWYIYVNLAHDSKADIFGEDCIPHIYVHFTQLEILPALWEGNRGLMNCSQLDPTWIFINGL